ncbi:MAG TPA: four helix bundle protein [Chitinophagaceae bacterium]|nr:four helix bundle protein [Chitinophagaceae bacterium]
MQKKLIEDNAILKLSFEFSLMILDYCERLDGLKKFIISKQLLRSGTSIGANAFEAQNSESKADFIHKMKIAAKEADETQYWLMLCSYAKEYPDPRLVLQMHEEVTKVLNAILTTAKRKNPLVIF